MLFTDGHLQSLEQLMKQPPRRKSVQSDKSKQTNMAAAPSASRPVQKNDRETK